MVIGALAELFIATQDRSLLLAAIAIADATTQKLFVTREGVLTETGGDVHMCAPDVHVDSCLSYKGTIASTR
eukprot:SAG31_NODE_165_length_21701_cov_9.786409_13_plen_72_part_00